MASTTSYIKPTRVWSAPLTLFLITATMKGLRHIRSFGSFLKHWGHGEGNQASLSSLSSSPPFPSSVPPSPYAELPQESTVESIAQINLKEIQQHTSPKVIWYQIIDLPFQFLKSNPSELNMPSAPRQLRVEGVIRTHECTGLEGIEFLVWDGMFVSFTKLCQGHIGRAMVEDLFDVSRGNFEQLLLDYDFGAWSDCGATRLEQNDFQIDAVELGGLDHDGGLEPDFVVIKSIHSGPLGRMTTTELRETRAGIALLADHAREQRRQQPQEMYSRKAKFSAPVRLPRNAPAGKQIVSEKNSLQPPK